MVKKMRTFHLKLVFTKAKLWPPVKANGIRKIKENRWKGKRRKTWLIARYVDKKNTKNESRSNTKRNKNLFIKKKKKGSNPQPRGTQL